MIAELFIQQKIEFKFVLFSSPQTLSTYYITESAPTPSTTAKVWSIKNNTNLD